MTGDKIRVRLRYLSLSGGDEPCSHDHAPYSHMLGNHLLTDHPVREDWQRGVYSAFREDGGALYVGRSERPFRRLRDHAKQSAWWPAVRLIEVVLVPCLRQLNGTERESILALQPRHNQRVPGGRVAS